MPSKHDQYAFEYDQLSKEYHNHLADVLFGLCFEDINPQEKILDVGIGTGISSVLFRKAGLDVYGIDGSQAMLSVCRTKNIAHELIEQDIQDLPWPYADVSIHHVISCGVFHFLGDLYPIFKEIQRVQISGGLFTFTVMLTNQKGEQQENFNYQIEDGFPVFTHSRQYINQTLSDLHYFITKEIVCLSSEKIFRVICAKKA